MKTKSTAGCLKENYGLHVCRKSSMISKSPLSRVRVAQNAEIETNTQSSQDVSLSDEVYAQDLGGVEGDHDELSNKPDLLRKQESPVTDSAIVGRRENLDMPQLDSEDSDDGSCSSCEFQACNVSDFYISDMIFSGPLIGTNSVLDNKADTMFLPDPKCGESSLLCDMNEEYMVLFFLENTLNTGHDHDCRPSEETIINADNSSLYMTIHQLRSYNQVSHVDMYPESDYECFDPQMYIRNLPNQPDMAFNLLPSSMANEKQNTKQITLVLDLDGKYVVPRYLVIA
ncbi:hypothetical protein DH2020_009123 [Rehmannia glutinosa]|uniref:Uncharacterized protein n=1 Tax=Rehmannia glutinosa TaxID=99300 RepID=A0ABR0X908_REHGL